MSGIDLKTDMYDLTITERARVGVYGVEEGPVNDETVEEAKCQIASGLQRDYNDPSIDVEYMGKVRPDTILFVCIEDIISKEEK